MILESIVTTLDDRNQINIAPMGPLIGNVLAMRGSNHDLAIDPEFLLRPYEGSQTFRNLLACRRATIHVTDDVSLFADAVIGRLANPESLVRRHPNLPHVILKNCHRWFAVEIEHVVSIPPRYELKCRTVDSQIQDAFFGFNRAKHAVIEAAILVTRTHLISRETAHQQIQSLRPLIEKTASDGDRDAFDRLVEEIDRRYSDVNETTRQRDQERS